MMNITKEIDSRSERDVTGFLVLRNLFAALLAIFLTQSAQAQDVVLEWNANAANAIVGVARQPPPRGLIRLAMVHAAMYDAVNAIEGYPFPPYAVTPNVTSPASPEAAAAAAAHDVLVALFP